jgi:Tfp pilus assembly protein PilF
MNKICVLLIFVLTACSTVSQRDRDRAALHLQIGTSHLMNGSYPAAMNELLIAERLDPKNPMIQNNLGLAYLVRGRAAQALEHINRALLLKPDYTDARNNQARVLIELGRYDEAIEAAQKTTDDLTFPNPEKPFFNIGLAYFKSDRFEQAKQAFQKSLEFQRDNCLAHNFLGRSYYELKDYALAAKQLDRAIGFCQSSQIDEPHYYSGLSYFQLGQQQRAEARLQETIKLYPNGEYRERALQMLETMRR